VYKKCARSTKLLNKSFEENFASHETLIETHEKLIKVHSYILVQKKKTYWNNKYMCVCNIIDDSIHAPIIIALTKISSSISNVITNTSLNLKMEH
jgi:hypothetical protein